MADPLANFAAESGDSSDDSEPENQSDLRPLYCMHSHYFGRCRAAAHTIHVLNYAASLFI